MTARTFVLTFLLASVPAVATAQAAQQMPAGAPPAAAPVSARDSLVDAQTRAIASQLRCPVCQGQSLQDSGSELAREMRGLISDQLRSGKSPDEVKAYFVSKYGEWILLEPEVHGFNTAVYLLPILALLAGAAVVLFAVRRWMRPVAASSEAGSGEGAGEAEPVRRLEAEQPSVGVEGDRS